MKKILLLVFILSSYLLSEADSKYSARSLNFFDYLKNSSLNVDDNLRVNNAKALVKEINGENYIDVFIELSKPEDASLLIEKGVKIGFQYGNIITANIPVSKLDEILDLDIVEKIEAPHQLRKKNDVARVSVGIDDVHKGTGLSQTYTGKGVIYGTVDVGIDFNHYAFKNEDLSSRIIKAYLPSDYTGTSPKGNVYDENGNITKNGTFPGSAYDKTKISTLSTDTRNEAHGTHTIGIGAGGYKGNNYYGMAPEADIIACGTSNLTDVNIMNCISYMLGNAAELNQPTVINLSLGENIGSHDGNSFTTRLIDELAGAGKIFVISAGNEGDVKLYINKVYQNDGDELKSFFADYEGGYSTLSGDFDAWSRTTSKFKTSIVVYSNSTKNIVYQSSEFVGADNGSSLTISSSSDSKLKSYFSGSISLNGAVYHNKYNMYGSIKGTAKSGYKVGVIYTADRGTQMDCWTDAYDLTFSDGSVSGWTDGSTDCSINDMATGTNSISVGAYSSRKEYPAIDGNTYEFNYSTLKDVVPFSSYGPDANGVTKPDIVGPGFFLISSISYYDTSYGTSGSSRSDLSLETTINGKKQRWGLMYGTSMSSPCVAGIIATWLQADPTLTPQAIKDIFSKTAKRDNYVSGGDPRKWGYGKIDAYSGLVEVLRSSSVAGAISDTKPVVIYPNPSEGEFSFMLPSEVGAVNVNIYDINGALVANRTMTATNDLQHIDVRGELSSGMYIVQITARNTNYTSRLVIK
ncbi:MAG: S8 family peptidase [Muribaculaceae bacterium]|nr:S8 family peptidase [Muribaculaceae bacterium]